MLSELAHFQINTKTLVMDLNHKSMKGFYAAGEVTNGIHGACLLVSCAIKDCLVPYNFAIQNRHLHCKIL